jgi:hypothetical protein
MTTSVVLQNGGVTRHQARVLVRHVTTAAQDTANAAVIAVDELTTVTEVFGVAISNASNVRRAPAGAVTISGRNVSIVDAGLAANDVITFTAVGV